MQQNRHTVSLHEKMNNCSPFNGIWIPKFPLFVFKHDNYIILEYVCLCILYVQTYTETCLRCLGYTFKSMCFFVFALTIPKCYGKW